MQTDTGSYIDRELEAIYRKREYHQQYYKEHKEDILEKTRKYQEENKDRILQQKKEYYR